MTAGMFFDVLGRPVMPCCGALILWTRPFQCLHEWESR